MVRRLKFYRTKYLSAYTGFRGLKTAGNTNITTESPHIFLRISSRLILFWVSQILVLYQNNCEHDKPLKCSIWLKSLFIYSCYFYQHILRHLILHMLQSRPDVYVIWLVNNFHRSNTNTWPIAFQDKNKK